MITLGLGLMIIMYMYFMFMVMYSTLKMIDTINFSVTDVQTPLFIRKKSYHVCYNKYLIYI